MALIRHPRGSTFVLVCVLLAVSACAPSGGSRSAAASSPAAPESPQPTPSPSAAAFPVQLTDDADRSVTVDAEPERIVSLAPSNTEIVCALRACDRLVGVTDYDDFPAEVADVPDVVIGAVVDPELVVAAEPDLVLAAGNEQTPSAVIEQLEELGLTVLVVYPETLEEVYANIELVGTAIGAADESAGLVAGMRDRVAAVEAAVEGVDRPVTYYEVFYSDVIFTAGDGSFLASLIELAGGEPVTGDAQGLIDAESLVAADPELILLGTASYDPSLAEPDAALETVSARPGWSRLSAVRSGAVVPYLDDVVTTRPGPRIVDGLEALAHAIHPEAFD